MNVLIIGGSNRFCNRLIQKMNKEGNRVYLLTGSHWNTDRYEHVFERYDFPYDSDSIIEIFDSVAPDVTIFMGAYDKNFPRSYGQKENVRFISGLINLLSGFATQRKGRFIYISSEAVFSGKSDAPIEEDSLADSSDLRGMAIAQGEALCDSFRLSRDLDILTVRIAGVYYRPKNLEEVDNLVASMCLEALDKNTVTVNSDYVTSVLNQKDAVEFLNSLIRTPEHEYSLYTISSGVTLSEPELGERVANIFEEKANAKRKAYQPPCRIISVSSTGRRNLSLKNTRFKDEFGINRLNDLDRSIGEIVEYMLSHEDVFLQDKQEALPWWKRLIDRMGWLFWTLLPFIENLIAFIPFFMLNNRATNSQYFAKLDFYLLYVLLFAIIHGQQQATFSAMLATAGYIFRQMYDRTGFEVLMDYNTYVWIAQLFILGLVVGYMKDRLKAQNEEAQENHSYMIGQIDDIKEINSSNVRVKDAMETQIINQSDSVGKIYEITSSLVQYNYDDVLFYAAEILEQIMGTEDVSIYSVSSGPYARLFTATSPKARSLGNSIKYVELTDMYNEIIEKRVFINRKLDPSLPMMTSAIYEDDKPRMLLMIWTLSWEKMTLGQANILAVTGALIQNAVVRASRYLEALENERFLGDTPILKPDAFASIISAYRNARSRSLTEYSMIKIDTEGKDIEEVGTGIRKKLRPADYVGELPNGDLYVLLTNTDTQGAAIVANRFQEAGFACEIVPAEKVSA